MRLLSIVEATSVTGPMKPLLAFSSHLRRSGTPAERFHHAICTTRRPAAAARGRDLLRDAAAAAGIEFLAAPEAHAGDVRVLRNLQRCIHAFEPSLVETHDSKSHFLFAALRTANRRIRRMPWVAFHHGYTLTSAWVRAYQHLDRVSLSGADVVNTVCLSFREQLEQRGVAGMRIRVTPNAIELPRTCSPAELDVARSLVQVPPDALLVLCVGRLSKEKGHADLIRASAAVLGAEGRKHVLVFVGDGPERPILERLSSDLGVPVRFLGYVADPSSLFQVADLFVLPSHTEGSPLVILEALGAELPIIATRVGGVPETLEDGVNALLCPPAQVETLSLCLAKALADDELRARLRRSARSAFRRNDLAVYATRLRAIYAEAIDHARSRH